LSANQGIQWTEPAWLGEAEAWIRERRSAGRRRWSASPEDVSRTRSDDDLATADGLKLFLDNGPIGTWHEPKT
jgi:hypothetical protein